MNKFMSICSAVKYSAKMKFIGCNPDEQIQRPEIKKAMRLTVQRMLHEEIYEKKYSQ